MLRWLDEIGYRCVGVFRDYRDCRDYREDVTLSVGLSVGSRDISLQFEVGSRILI